MFFLIHWLLLQEGDAVLHKDDIEGVCKGQEERCGDGTQDLGVHPSQVQAPLQQDKLCPHQQVGQLLESFI